MYWVFLFQIKSASRLFLSSKRGNLDALAVGCHLVDLSNSVCYVSGRSRVRLVGFSEFGNIVDNVAGAAAFALVQLALVVLFLEDLPNGDASSLPRTAPIGELLEATGAALEFSVSDQFESVEDVDLDALLVF